MAEEQPILRDDEPDGLPSVPSHSPLPPPPEVHYTRPDLKSAAPSPAVLRRPSSGMASQGDTEESSAVSLGAGLAAGITFASSIVVGYLIGQWVDHRWLPNGPPIGIIVFSLAGVAAGFLNLFRILFPGKSVGKRHDQ